MTPRSWASPRCRTPPIWPARGTTPGSRATSRSSPPTSSCSNSSSCWRRRAGPSCGPARSCTARSAAAGNPNEQDDDDGQEEAERARKKMKEKKYEKELMRLQGKLCVLQDWVKEKGLRVIVVFEGRDAAGKGGTIKAITERTSPRIFRLVALPAPSDREKSQMYAAAVHAALSRRRRDRHLRPQLVQPGRRRARDGVRPRRAVRAVPQGDPALREADRSTAGSSSSSSGSKSATRNRSGDSRPASTIPCASGS